jgi:hypothetical protein
LAFWYYNKIPEINNLKEERFILAHSFSVSDRNQLPGCFGPVMRWNIMVRAHGGAELFTSWWWGSREKQEGPGFLYSLQGHNPNDLRAFH